MRSRIATTALAFGALSCAVAVSFDEYSASDRKPLTLYGARGVVLGLEGNADVSLTLNNTPLRNIRNGPFAFPPSFADKTAWRLSVVPDDTFSRCTVTPPLGVIDAADIEGVEVRCVSSDATLAELVVFGREVTSTFDPETSEYYLVGPPSVYFTLNVRPRSKSARVTVDGRLVDYTGNSQTFLPTFTGEIQIDVTASDRVTTKQYFVRQR